MIEDSKLIANYIYFYHLDKFCVLPMYPESVSDNMTTKFRETNALSRSAPVFTFQNSGPRTVTISLDLHRDLMNDINTNVSNLKSNVEPFQSVYDADGKFIENDYVDTLVNYLQSMALPKYKIYNTGSKSVEPPMVAVRFGDDIFIKGVVTSGVQVTYKKPIITVVRNGKTYNKYAVISINFTVSEVDPYDSETVAQKGSFRGITQTFQDGIYISGQGSSQTNLTELEGPSSPKTPGTDEDTQKSTVVKDFRNLFGWRGDTSLKAPNTDFNIRNKNNNSGFGGSSGGSW